MRFPGNLMKNIKIESSYFVIINGKSKVKGICIVEKSLDPNQTFTKELIWIPFRKLSMQKFCKTFVEHFIKKSLRKQFPFPVPKHL